MADGSVPCAESPDAREQAWRLPLEGVEVVWKDELDRLPGSAEVVDGIRHMSGRVEVEVEDVAIYHLVGGTRVEILVLPGSDRETAWFFLKATPFGILVQQRGRFPLHAGALVPPGGGPALLVAGDSGAGKSTACAALVARGWTLLNDDISQVDFGGLHPMVLPGFRAIKLGADSARLLGFDPETLPRTRGFKEKHYLPSDSGLPRPAKVGALLVLEDAPVFRAPARIAGMELLGTVYRQTFRPHLVVALGFQKDHFAQVVRFCGAVPCFLSRGNRNLPPAELARAFESWFADAMAAEPRT